MVDEYGPGTEQLDISYFIIYTGICEPIDSFQCRGKSAYLDCAKQAFSCAALEEDGKLIYLSLHLSYNPDFSRL